MQRVWVLWVWVLITIFDRSTRWFEEYTCSARAEDPRSIFQSPAVFTKTMVQGPTCLANVGAGAFSTWDAVHHTFPAIGCRASYILLVFVSALANTVKGTQEKYRRDYV